MDGYGQAQLNKSTENGLNIFEDRLQTAHATVDQVFNNLAAIESRLYSPRPSPVTGNTKDGAVKSIEGTLNHLISRLHELETLSGKLLHG